MYEFNDDDEVTIPLRLLATMIGCLMSYGDSLYGTSEASRERGDHRNAILADGLLGPVAELIEEALTFVRQGIENVSDTETKTDLYRSMTPLAPISDAEVTSADVVSEIEQFLTDL